LVNYHYWLEGDIRSRVNYHWLEETQSKVNYHYWLEKDTRSRVNYHWWGETQSKVNYHHWSSVCLTNNKTITDLPLLKNHQCGSDVTPKLQIQTIKQPYSFSNSTEA